MLGPCPRGLLWKFPLGRRGSRVGGDPDSITSTLLSSHHLRFSDPKEGGVDHLLVKADHSADRRTSEVCRVRFRASCVWSFRAEDAAECVISK